MKSWLGLRAPSNALNEGTESHVPNKTTHGANGVSGSHGVRTSLGSGSVYSVNSVCADSAG